jgi:hypothetical protein
MKERATEKHPIPGLARDPFLFRVVAGTLVIHLLVAALVVFSLFVSRRHYEERANIWSRNTSKILEDNLVRAFDKIGLVLASAAYETQRQLAAGGIRQADLEAFLREQALGVPELFSLRVTDAAGRLSYGTAIPGGERVDVSDRDYFRNLLSDRRDGRTAAQFIQGRITGRWNIVLARRINRADGSFAGAVVGAFEVGSFARLFADLEIGRQGAIGVRDQAFRLVALAPPGLGPGSQIGSDLVSERTRAMIQTHPVTATYKTSFARDHIERLVTFRRVSEYPFYIFATCSPADYLGPWYWEAAIALTLLAVFVLATTLLGKALLTSEARELARLEAVRLGQEWRSRNEELSAALTRVRRLEGVIPICAYCKKIRTEDQSWNQLENYFSEHTDAVFTHGACPDCKAEQLRDLKPRNP